MSITEIGKVFFRFYSCGFTLKCARGYNDTGKSMGNMGIAHIHQETRCGLGFALLIVIWRLRRLSPSFALPFGGFHPQNNSQQIRLRFR